MAHFAKIGMNSKVMQVLTLDNKDMNGMKKHNNGI